MNFPKDGFSGGGPHEGSGLSIVVLDEAFDLFDQFFDAGERSAADRLLGDDAEPALDLIEPRGVGPYRYPQPGS